MTYIYLKEVFFDKSESFDLTKQRKMKGKTEHKHTFIMKLSFIFPDDINFNLCEVLAFSFIGIAQPFDFSKMSLQSFGILIEI